MYWLDRFRRDEQGSASIEFVLWAPIIAALLVVMIDATTLYITHTEMWNVARDTARHMVAGQITSETEAETFAAERLNMFENPYTVDAHFDPDAYMSIYIATDIADAMVFGAFLRPLLNDTIQVRVVMRSEPEIGTGS